MIILKGKPGDIKHLDNLGAGPIEIRILAIDNGEVQLAIGPGPRQPGTANDRRSYRCTDLPLFLRKQAD